MANHGRRLGALLVGLLLIEALARLLASTSTPAIRWYDATAQLKIEQLDDLDRVDVVFAGTSMAWQAFVPSEFTAETGLTAYNAGLAGGTPEVMDRWLLEEVVPRVEPDVVVWGLSSLDLAPAYGPENAATYDEALQTRTSRLGEVERALSPWSTVVAERSVLRSMSDLWGPAESKRTAQFDAARSVLGEQGERLDFRADRTDERARVMQARLREFSIGRDDVDTIISTVSALQARGIEVILVELPVPPEFIELHPGGTADYQTVGARLASIAELQHVRFLRLTDGYESGDFVDFTHLDQPAAVRLTREFAAEWNTARSDLVGLSSSAATPATAGEDCETEFVEDEYGNQIEICVADGALPVSPPADKDIRARAAEFDLFASAVLSACASADPGIDSAVDLTVFPDADQPNLAAVLEVAASLAGACPDGVAVPEDLARLAEALEQVSAMTPDPDRPEPSSTQNLTSRLAAALDGAFGYFELADPQNQSLFWARLDEFVSATKFQQRGNQAEPATVLIGSSQTFSIDTDLLDAAFDGAYIPMGVEGFDAEERDVILRRDFEGHLPATVLWLTSTHRLIGDALGLPCATVSNRVTLSVDYRAALFALTGWSGTDADGLLGSDLLASSYFRIPFGQTALFGGIQGDEDWTFGGVPERERARYQDAAVCPERLDLLERQIQSLLDDGVTVVMILHPPHQAFLDLAPEAHAEARRLVEEMVARLGIEMIAPADLTDEETNDGIHTDAGGRRRITTAVLERLDELGLLPGDE